MTRIVLDGFISSGNGADGIKIGPGVDAQLTNVWSSGNGGAGVRIDPRSDVKLTGGGASGNVDGGVVIETIPQLFERFPYLEQVDKGLIEEAANIVSSANPAEAEQTLMRTRLYEGLKSIRGIEWAQLAVGLAQLAPLLAK